MIIVTADPGASPESVESDITKPMEQSMATLDQIKEVTSTSENSVSMVMLEFEDGVNMDTISVDIQQKISVLQGQWDDTVGAPYVLKINPSVLPVMVAAVSQEGKDVYELSDLVTDELTGKLEGISGVAGVDVSGAVTREAHVILDQQKMDDLSATLADAVKKQLKKAEGKLHDAEKQVEEGQDALDSAKRGIADGVAGAAGDVVDKVRTSCAKSTRSSTTPISATSPAALSPTRKYAGGAAKEPGRAESGPVQAHGRPGERQTARPGGGARCPT